MDTTGASHHVSSQPRSLGVGRGAGDTAQERLQLLRLPLTNAPWQRAARAEGGECPSTCCLGIISAGRRAHAGAGWL